MRIPRSLLVFLGLSGWLALAATLLPVGPLRFTLSLLYVVSCPGGAFVCAVAPLLRWRGRAADPLEVAALTMAVSLSLTIMVSEVFFLRRSFSLYGSLSALAAVTTLLVLIAWWRERRAVHRPAPAVVPEEGGEPDATPAEPESPDGKSTGKPHGKSRDESSGRSPDESSSRSPDEPLDTPLDEPLDTPLDEPLDTPLDEPLDTPLDEPLDKPVAPAPREPDTRAGVSLDQ